jgi:hypothetical protein
MPYYGLLRHVALVKTDVSKEPSASITRVTRIGDIGRTLAVTSNRNTSILEYVVFLRSVHRLLVTANVVPSSLILTLMMEALGYSETWVLTRATPRNIPEDTIFIVTAVKTSNLTRDFMLAFVYSVRHNLGRKL